MYTSKEKLADLRKSMTAGKINVYLIPSSDPHIGEYVPDYWRVISWLTGFTGSAATVAITDTFAGLWTDSRYFIQAENQLLDSGFTLMKQVLPDNKDLYGWLQDNLNIGGTVGFDGRTFPIERMRKIEKSLESRNVIFDVHADLITELWTDRPLLPDAPAFDLTVDYCGKTRSLKISEVREQMIKQNVDYHLLTAMDDINWLLNIRGSDIKYSPLFASFAIVYQDQILLFADEHRIPLKLAKEFDDLGIVILPYDETAGILSTLPSESSILIHPGTTSAELYNSIPEGMKIIEGISIPTRLKAVRNRIEIENLGKVMIKDGVALTRFFYRFEQQIGKIPMSELSVSEQVNQLRSEQENFLGPSFSTIAAWNEHGALPHYSATAESNLEIGEEGILLLDSGGQYLEGTTDITRTIVVGNPSAKQIKDFTLVLKGTINLALAKFPYGTKGYQLDVLARKALWENGMNYGHGTGHGVGFCLNVHEGPQSISPVAGSFSAVLEPGMLISDEPAIYREGEYGIRTENLILCYEDEETGFGRFLRFDTISLCYIEKSLIDISLLTEKEINWINRYHSEV